MSHKRKLSLVSTPVAVAPVAAPTGPTEKLEAAKAFLADRYCMHPQFDVKKLKTGLLSTWRASLERYRP